MYLLEHDAKTLLEAYGVAVPPGLLFSSIGELFRSDLGPGPWVVKGQVGTGGRGKAGLVKKAETREEVVRQAGLMLGQTIKGHQVGAVRVEQNVEPALEAYIALMLAADEGAVRVLVSGRGGMDIEAMAEMPDTLISDVASLSRDSLVQCIGRMARAMPQHLAEPLSSAGKLLSEAFVGLEALLVEINPLFIKPNGVWVAGDAKIVTDDSSIERQPALHALALARPAVYQDAALKLQHGFEYVVVDPLGEIGLITSGAGLSMMLIDELKACGLKPYNFLDIHAGSFHGKTTRLVQTLEWILEGKNVKLIMVNIMAGGIDLGEFSRVMFAAFEEIHLDLPVVIRFAGRNLAEAQALFQTKEIPLHTDLDEAVAEVRRRMSAMK